MGCSSSVQTRPSAPSAPNAPNAPPCGYSLLRELGQGSFATVFLARHAQHGLVAVKEVCAQSADGAAAAATEVKAMRALDHPSIVRLIDHFRVGDSVVLVEDFCGGGDLRKATLEAKPEEEVVRGWMRQTLRALRHAHSRGVVHRDVKPANCEGRGGGAC
jgi:serine/threonine protein kinase